MKKENIHTGLSVIAIIFSITAICLAYTNAKPLSWDIAGVLVSILSILVTVLIGWQIYTIMDIGKRIDNQVNIKISEYKDQAHKLNDIEHAHLYGQMYLRDGIANMENNRAFAIQSFIFAAREFHSIDDNTGEIEMCISYIIRLLNEGDIITMEETRKSYINTLHKIQCRNIDIAIDLVYKHVHATV